MTFDLPQLSQLCSEPNCYKSAQVTIYRGKKKLCVCKEHVTILKKAKQMEIFNESHIPSNTLR